MAIRSHVVRPQSVVAKVIAAIDRVVENRNAYGRNIRVISLADGHGSSWS